MLCGRTVNVSYLMTTSVTPDLAILVLASMGPDSYKDPTKSFYDCDPFNL
jgi:hypothetical protein